MSDAQFVKIYDDMPARFIPVNFFRKLGDPYRPELGFSPQRRSQRRHNDDQEIEWIRHETRMPAAIVSNPETIVVVRPIIAPMLQSRFDSTHQAKIRVAAFFRAEGSVSAVFLIAPNAEVSRIPAILCQTLSIPCATNLFNSR
jgi:hypothetical protein